MNPISRSAASEIRNPKSGISIVFMATSSVALPTLKRLFEEGYRIGGVITQPDKPTGRGQAVQGPPVKKLAFDLQLAVYQPGSLKDDHARSLFQALAPDMIIVVAYGKILPLWLLKLPRFGCLNLHGSLLPKYRGAAPIQWALANGETVTGVSTMLLDEGLDTGPVFLRERTAIEPGETAQELSERLSDIGSHLVVRTIEGIVDGTLSPQPQNDAEATLAPILKKEDALIDWTMRAERIHNRVRAFHPWPGTVTVFRNATCKILKTRIADRSEEACEPGLLAVTKCSLFACCGESTMLELIEVQPENRKPMPGADFARGARIQPGEKFRAAD